MPSHVCFIFFERKSEFLLYEIVVDLPNYRIRLGLGNPVLELFSEYLSYKLVSTSQSLFLLSKDGSSLKDLLADCGDYVRQWC